MKSNFNLLACVLTLFILAACLKMYLESDSYNLRCIISDVDSKQYCVREKDKLYETADLLATVTNKLKKLVDITYEKHKNNEDVQTLYKRFNPSKVSEILPTSKYTAYSENKGEKLAFCTTTEKTNNIMIDENTLTFVGIHEISHIMTKSVGHKKEFWQNFKFLLDIAVENNIYNPVNYKKKPQKYCGMDITDNPYYDMV